MKFEMCSAIIYRTKRPRREARHPKMNPPELYPRPTIQSRPTAQGPSVHDDDLYIMLMRGGVCKSRKSSLSISVTYDDASVA